MALTGELNTSYYSNMRFKWRFRVDKQDIATNTTTYHWYLGHDSLNTTSWYNCGAIRVYINDAEVFYLKGPETYQGSGQIKLANNVTIKHDAAGRASLKVRVEGGIYVYGAPNVSGEETFVLDPIPRKAVIKDAYNSTDENLTTLRYDNPAGSAASLGAYILDENGNTLVYGVPKSTESWYKFSPREHEVQAIYRYLATAVSRPISYKLETTISGSTFEDIKSGYRISIEAGEPLVNLQIKDTNPKVTEVTGSNQILISGQSNVEFKLTATPRKGASIVSTEVTNGKQKSSELSGVFNHVTDGRFSAIATDSRGAVSSRYSYNLTVYSYIPPTVSIFDASMDTSGKLSFSFGGNAFQGSFGSKPNAIKARYKVWKKNESDPGWTDCTASLQLNSASNSYRCNISVSGLEYVGTYKIYAQIEDLLTVKNNGPRYVETLPLYAVGKDTILLAPKKLGGPLHTLGGLPLSYYLKSGDDFNKIYIPGTYGVTTWDDADGIGHMPSRTLGLLYVTSAWGYIIDGGTWNYIRQEFIGYSSGQRYCRTGNSNETPGVFNFSEWTTM